MNHYKAHLIKAAVSKYETIAPCSDKTSLEECFTVDNDKLLFWFNTPDCSTHLLVEVMV